MHGERGPTEGVYPPLPSLPRPPQTPAAGLTAAAPAVPLPQKIKKTGKTHIDQCVLVLTRIRIVNATKSETWVASYRRVTLNPRTRVSFKDWCKKSWQFILTITVFTEENSESTPQELFDLVPAFWHGMEPSQRWVVSTVLQSY